MYDKEKIIKNFSPLIKSSIKKYFANYINYEDAYQDGVVKILELLESYKGGGKVSLECYLKYQLKYFYMQKFFKRKLENEKTYTKIYQTKDDETVEVLELIVDENIDIQKDIETNEINKSKNALSVNLIAIEEIIRQISFRDISGIIIVDFINMKTKDKEILEEKIKEIHIFDNKIWNFHGFTKLGLYEITRQRGK